MIFIGLYGDLFTLGLYGESKRIKYHSKYANLGLIIKSEYMDQLFKDNAKNATSCTNNDISVAFADWLAFDQTDYAFLPNRMWVYGIDFKNQLTTKELFEIFKKKFYGSK